MELPAMRIIASKELYWEGYKLYFQDQLQTELIPHAEHPNHFHLKFRWRDEPTPEFFNIFNARENARVYSRRRLQDAQETVGE